MRRWLSLSPVERGMLIAAFVAQLAIAAALRVLPFRLVRRVLARTAAPRRSARRSSISIPWLQWAVAASGRRMGRASTCLTRTLTVQWLASRRGIAVPVHIGVRRGAALDAHAWIGETEEGAYARLASFEGKV